MPIQFFETPPVRRVGVIGWPIEHSISPAMHTAAFEALGLHGWHYDRYAIPPDIVRISLREFRDHGFVGLNVTVPLKEAVVPFVRPDEVALAVGAVNTITFRGNEGTNTDVRGFIDDLAAHGVAVAGQPVVVLGAGGAARAAVYGLSRAGAVVHIANRTPDRARALFAHMGLPERLIAPDAIAALGPALVVNTTPLGMAGGGEPAALPFDPAALTTPTVVYDMVYRPAETPLLAAARAHGHTALNGLGMLVRQGAAAFSLWTGAEAPIDVMFAAARAALEPR
jgi:shikimate dehydrogenase